MFSFDADTLSLPDHVSEEASTFCKVAGMYQFSESPSTKLCNGNENIVPSVLSRKLSKVPSSIPKQVQVPVIVGAKRPLPADYTMRGSEPTKKIKVSLGDLFVQTQQQQQEQTIRREENPAAVAARSKIKRLIEKVGRPKQASVGQSEKKGISGFTSLMWLADVGKLLGETMKQGKANFARREPMTSQKTKLMTTVHMQPPALPAFSRSISVQPVSHQSSVSIPPVRKVSNSHQILAEEQCSNGSGSAGAVGSISKILSEELSGEAALSNAHVGSNAAVEVTKSQMTTSSNTDNELQSNHISVVNIDSSINCMTETDQEGIPPNQSTSDGNDAPMHVLPAVHTLASTSVDNEKNAENETISVAEKEQTTTVPQSLIQVSDNQLATDKESLKLVKRSSSAEVSLISSEIAKISTPVVSDKQQTPTSECSTLPVTLTVSPVKPQYDSPTKIALKDVEVKMYARLPVTPSKFRASPSKDIAMMRQFHIPIEPLPVCSSPQQHSSNRELRWLARNKLKEDVKSKQQDKTAPCNVDSSFRELKEKQTLERTLDSDVPIRTQNSNLEPHLQNKDDDPTTTTVANVLQPSSEVNLPVHCSDPSLTFNPATSTLMSVSVSNFIPSCTCILTTSQPSSNLTTTCTSTSDSTADAILSSNSKPLTFYDSTPNSPSSSISSTTVQTSPGSIENTPHSFTLENVNPVSNTAKISSHSAPPANVLSPKSDFMPPYVSPFPLSVAPLDNYTDAASICVPSSDKNVLFATTNSSENGAIEPLLSDLFSNETTSISITNTSTSCTTPASATTSVNDSDLIATLNVSAASDSVTNSPSCSNAAVNPSISTDNTYTSSTLSNVPVSESSIAVLPSLISTVISSNDDTPDFMCKTPPSSRSIFSDTAVEQRENENQLDEPFHLETQTPIDVLPIIATCGGKSDDEHQPLINLECPTSSGSEVPDQVDITVATNKRVGNLFANSCDGNVESKSPSEETSVETKLEDVQQPVIDAECTDNALLMAEMIDQPFEDISSGNAECDQMQVDSQKGLVNDTKFEVNNPACTPNSEDPVTISLVGEEKELTQYNDDRSSTSAVITISAQNRPESFASEICSPTISTPTNSCCNLASSFSVHSPAGSEQSSLQSFEPVTVEPKSDVVSDTNPKVKNVSLIKSVGNLLEQIEQQKSSTSDKTQSKAQNNSSSKASVHLPVTSIKRMIQTRSRSRSVSSTQSPRNSRSNSVEVVSTESLPAEGDNSYTSR